MRHVTRTLFALLLVAGLTHATPAKAQLQEVEQTVFGMDCAPCAYGLEKRFKGIDGVEVARVSLNEGFAEVELASGNSLTLDALRSAVRDSGFSPREATIRATGTLEKEGDSWILVLPTGDRFLLERADDQADAYRRLQEGRVTITGRVTRDKEPFRDAYALALLAVDSQA